MIQNVKNKYHLVQSLLACAVYKFPARKMTVIGVTGTDGKTTTANLIYHLLKEKGYNAAVISTIGAYVNGKLSDTGFHVTTPSGFELQKIISQIQKQKVSYLVLEITSHALDQNRAFGIPIHTAVLTNITHEHMDYHKTRELYQKAKFKLFKNTKIAVLNEDDPSFDLFSRNLKKKKILSYSLKKESATLTPKKAGIMGDDFNMSNQLAALLAVGAVTGAGFSEFVKGIESFQLPQGRQEYIYLDSYAIMVDFAHTPHAISSILGHLRGQVKGRIIHVFGSAGDRDRSKRPLMGKESSEFSDVIIITSEDPRYEDPLKIAEDIKGGISDRFIEVNTLSGDSKNEYMVISDRKSAIQKALEIVGEKDLILITGKGHEKSMNILGIEYDWSDKDVTLSLL